MIVFQLLTIPLTLWFFLVGVTRLFAGERPLWAALLRPVLWLTAAVTIWRPELTTTVARWLGIGRGADLVLYALAVAFLVAAFYFYQKHRKLEADLTNLVRHIAMNTVEPPDEGSDSGAET